LPFSSRLSTAVFQENTPAVVIVARLGILSGTVPTEDINKEAEEVAEAEAIMEACISTTTPTYASLRTVPLGNINLQGPRMVK
jgi:hypothetical protein